MVLKMEKVFFFSTHTFLHSSPFAVLLPQGLLVSRGSLESRCQSYLEIMCDRMETQVTLVRTEAPACLESLVCPECPEVQVRRET